MNKNLKLFAIFLFVLFISFSSLAKEFSVSSPNKKNELRINVDEKVTFSLFNGSNTLISPSSISLEIYNGKRLGVNPEVIDIQTKSVDTIIYPVVKQKSEKINDAYNELKINFTDNYSIIFRAYNDGAAYRFETNIKDSIKIKSEEVSFNFTGDDTVYFPQEESFISHNERLYKKLAMNQTYVDSFCSLPVLVSTIEGINVLITEADLYDYPGLWLKVNDEQNFSGIFPHYVLKEEVARDVDPIILERADYIAHTEGTRTYPWRVMAIAENDGDLILNQLVYLLSRPVQIEETSWIKHGKVAWDWWNDWNIYGVDFKAGINTETYKYYIDFASKYNIEYIILDAGWYKGSTLYPIIPEMKGDLTAVNPDINMEELLAYAEEKNVDIILWAGWKTLDRQLDEALDLYEKWGIKGIKVDYMQRDDQWMVNYYWRIAEAAAKRKLLVDFHGSYKPAGLRRAFPNVINREGVRGLEHCKWSDEFIPEHEVTIPFIRMVAGPMDYTPGAMINMQENDFRAIYSTPMSMGTRVHQLAMFVIYEAPLQMLSDSPSNYLNEPEAMEFLSKVPTVWDETKVLEAKISEYLVLARRNGDEWYLGAMSGKNSYKFTIDFSFLGTGDYTIEIYEDGVNADKYGSDYKKSVFKISNDSELEIKLAPAGGWAARIYKE